MAPQGSIDDLRRAGTNPDYWYPVALSKDVKRGETLAVSFAELEIVLVRSKSGVLYALEDRCAHRQVPLSRGKVSGERLRCSYHGWTYDRTGACTAPNWPKDAPSPRGVRSFPVEDAGGLIYVFPGDPEYASQRSLPDPGEGLVGDVATITFNRRLDCHYTFLHENLMDMSHQVLHHRWMGRFLPKIIDFRQSDTTVEVDYTADFGSGGFYLRTLPTFFLRLQQPGGPVRSETAIHTQDDFFVTVATEYPYQTLTLFRRGFGHPVLRLWLSYVPGNAAQTTTSAIGAIVVTKPVVPGILTALRPILFYFADRIFHQDRLAMEAEQRAYDLRGRDENQEAAPFLLSLRALLMAKGVPISPEPARPISVSN